MNNNRWLWYMSYDMDREIGRWSSRIEGCWLVVQVVLWWYYNINWVGFGRWQIDPTWLLMDMDRLGLRERGGSVSGGLRTRAPLFRHNNIATWYYTIKLILISFFFFLSNKNEKKMIRPGNGIWNLSFLIKEIQNYYLNLWKKILKNIYKFYNLHLNIL
jgi:hypothetical protein